MKAQYISVNVESQIGIRKKILGQIHALNNLGVQTNYVQNIQENNLRLKILRRCTFNNYMIKWSEAYEQDIDIYYIRYPLADLSFIKFLKKIKKNNIETKIIVEIPTYPYESEDIKGSKVFKLKDKFFRKKMRKYVDRIATYSKDKEIFNIPTINISNGVDLDSIKPKKNIEHTEINLIAVAAFSTWHGYDRCLKGMATYYRNNPKQIVNLHLVGDGDELDYYKRLTKELNLEDYVYMYGNKIGKELDEVYDICDIGLDALARHRSGIYYNSSLKGKEYAAKGIPIISGVETELDSKYDFRFYMRVPADDSELNIYDIIDFYKKIYQTEKDIIEINKEIRKFARNNFDIQKCMKPVVEYIQLEK